MFDQTMWNCGADDMSSFGPRYVTFETKVGV